MPFDSNGSPLDPWKVLGIAPTNDERLVRRAYSAKLKFVRPEDDAEGFQRLRRAYEFALQQTRGEKVPLIAALPADQEHTSKFSDDSTRIDAKANWISGEIDLEFGSRRDAQYRRDKSSIAETRARIETTVEVWIGTSATTSDEMAERLRQLLADPLFISLEARGELESLLFNRLFAGPKFDLTAISAASGVFEWNGATQLRSPVISGFSVTARDAFETWANGASVLSAVPITERESLEHRLVLARKFTYADDTTFYREFEPGMVNQIAIAFAFFDAHAPIHLRNGFTEEQIEWWNERFSNYEVGRKKFDDTWAGLWSNFRGVFILVGLLVAAWAALSYSSRKESVDLKSLDASNVYHCLMIRDLYNKDAKNVFWVTDHVSAIRALRDTCDARFPGFENEEFFACTVLKSSEACLTLKLRARPERQHPSSVR